MNYTAITESLLNSVQSIWVVITNFAPRFFSALFLLIIGYLLAKFIGKIVKIALDKADINKIAEKVGLAQLLVSWNMPPDISRLIGKLCFAFVFLIFLISSADVLQLNGLSATIDKFLQYLPNIIGALFIFFLASIAGHFAKQAMTKAGESLRLDFTGALGNLLYYALMLIGFVLAIGQLKIETAFLTHVIEIVLVTAGVAIALSLGIGSRDVSKNLISGIYLKETLTEGAFVKIDGKEGTLTSVNPISFELQLASGEQLILPNCRLLECEIIQKV